MRPTLSLLLEMGALIIRLGFWGECWSMVFTRNPQEYCWNIRIVLLVSWVQWSGGWVLGLRFPRCADELVERYPGIHAHSQASCCRTKAQSIVWVQTLYHKYPSFLRRCIKSCPDVLGESRTMSSPTRFQNPKP